MMPFWIDLGAAFDTFNLRSTVAPGVLSPAQDAALENFAPDTVSGYAVNTIAIELPDRPADADRAGRAGDLAGGDDRCLGHDVAAARHRSARAIAACRIARGCSARCSASATR